MDARRTAALQEALSAHGVELEEPVRPLRWRGHDGGGPVLVTAVLPRSRVHLAAVRVRADRLARLRHRGLAEVLACVTAADHVAVVQREVPGTDLATLLLGRRAWRLPEVLGVVADVADALGVLHGAGLVHGDVSPANVVVDEGGRATLVDLLGAADGLEMGTPGWAAPERATGATQAGDVFSLGALAATLLERCAPQAVPPVLDRCRAPDPRARPTAAEVAAVVLRAAVVEPLRAVEPSVLAAASLQQQVAREVDSDRTVRRPVPARGRHRRRGPARGTFVPVVVGVVLIGATLVGLRAAHGPDASAGPTVGAVPAGPVVVVPPDTAAAARAAIGLTRRRASALADGALLRLLSVTEPGSPAAATDRSLWVPGGSRRGDVVVRSARPVRARQGEWHVAVRVDDAGASQDVVLHLVVDGGRWLVRAVSAG